ncbi:MAG: hypothetical protein OIF32_07685, partial [Campylobacterales bacterium]|nr:hypothetical protein [Campylobacterales bacterium]
KNGGDVDVLYKTTKYLFNELEDDLILYPSHDYFLSNLKFSKTVDTNNEYRDSYIKRRESMDLDNEFILTTVKEEKRINPFFRLFDPEFKQKYPNMTEKELFLDFRSKRDKW